MGEGISFEKEPLSLFNWERDDEEISECQGTMGREKEICGLVFSLPGPDPREVKFISTVTEFTRPW